MVYISSQALLTPLQTSHFWPHQSKSVLFQKFEAVWFVVNRPFVVSTVTAFSDNQVPLSALLVCGFSLHSDRFSLQLWLKSLLVYVTVLIPTERFHFFISVWALMVFSDVWISFHFIITLKKFSYLLSLDDSSASPMAQYPKSVQPWVQSAGVFQQLWNSLTTHADVTTSHRCGNFNLYMSTCVYITREVFKVLIRAVWVISLIMI